METLTKSTNQILGDIPARDVLVEIFADLHPGLIDEDRSITSIFTPQSAREFLDQLTDITSLLSEEDSFEETLAKLQSQINQAEEIRDDLLEQVFTQLRPIERSYRELQTFFENTKIYDGKQRKPIELFIWNTDPREIKGAYSMTIAAVENFCKKRNDNFNFRDDICNLVIPGWISQPVRERLESIANQWGILLITDIDDEKSFQNVERNFRPGGKYEFLSGPKTALRPMWWSWVISSCARNTGSRRQSTTEMISTDLRHWPLPAPWPGPMTAPAWRRDQ